MRREYIDKIVQNAPVEYYLSANDNAVVWWPFRMQPVHEANPTYVDMCEKFIVDSSFNDESITNKDALDKAHELNATMVMLEDVYQDFEGTVQTLQDGLELAKNHDYDGTVLAPLQSPHVECWEEIGNPDTIAIGGLKDAHASEKVRVAQKVRGAVGDNVWIHGLGFGATNELIRAIRNEPNLLDSIDSRTPYETARSSSIWKGDSPTTVASIRSQATLLEKTRRMQPTMSNDPAPTESLEAYQ